MKISIRETSAIALFCFFGFFLRCSSQHVTGVGTGSETVIGQVVHRDGKPAGETVVTLYPSDYDPVNDSGFSAGIDTTDSNGNYSILLPSKNVTLYTLHAVNLSSQTRTIVADIEISDGESTFVEMAELRNTGSIKVLLTDSSADKNGYVYIPGTFYHSYIENGCAIIDSVPAQIIRSVSYKKNESGGLQSLSENVYVESQITTVIANSRQMYSRNIFLNTSATGADISGMVTDFPVLLRLRSSNFDFSKTKEDGSDLRFKKADRKTLPFEIEIWDLAKGVADIWIKVDTVYGNNSTQFIAMYWGDTDADGGSDGAAVFDTASGYQGVWHLSDNEEQVMDATANENHGLKRGNQAPTEGNVGFGQSFNGSGDYSDMGNVCNTDTFSFTVSAWVKKHGENKIRMIMSKSNGDLPNPEYGWLFQLDPDGAVQIFLASDTGSWGDVGSFVLSSDMHITDSSWHHVAAVIDRTNNDNCRVYIDGTDVSTLPSGGNIVNITRITNPLPLRIGSESDGGYQWEGSLDECRISYKAHSPQYIKLCFMNQKSNDKLVIVE